VYKLRKGRNYEEVIMGEILLRIIIAAASAALLTTEGAKKWGKMMIIRRFLLSLRSNLKQHAETLLT
jgi:hypothetical protein